MDNTVFEGNKLIAEFDGYVFNPNRILNYVSGVFEKDGMMPMLPSQFKYHTSWDWLHPVYRKVAEIGLWMMTNGYDKLWLEKIKEIDTLILTEETPQKAATKIAQLIQWYNNNQKSPQ